MYGYTCKYIRRLCSRSILSTSIPSEDEWSEIYGLDLAAAPLLSSRAFLKRLGIEARVSAAAKIKAEYEVCDRSDKAGIARATEQIIDNFAVSGRNYVGFLMSSVKTHSTLKTELMKGLASFDPTVLFVLPTNVGLYHFTALYGIFRRGKWVKPEDEQLCIEEYLSFVDNLRIKYAELVKSPQLLFDVVDFLIGLPSLRERPLLDYVFRLSCLCLTGGNAELPVVVLGTKTSEDLSCRVSEAVFPVQSYLLNVPESTSVCTSQEAIGRYLSSLEDMDINTFSTTYDPWGSVDLAGRSGIYVELMKTYRKLHPLPSPPKTSSEGTPSDSGKIRMLQPPSRVQGRINYGNVPESEIDSTAARIRSGKAGCSKDS